MNAIDIWYKLLFMSNYKEELINTSYTENNVPLEDSSIDVHVQDDDNSLLAELLDTDIFVNLDDQYTGIDGKQHHTSYCTTIKTGKTYIYITIDSPLDHQYSTPIKDILDGT